MPANIIQIWHCSECNMKFYCTMKIDIARGEAECDINFQSAIKFHFARTCSAIFVLLYDCFFRLTSPCMIVYSSLGPHRPPAPNGQAQRASRVRNLGCLRLCVNVGHVTTVMRVQSAVALQKVILGCNITFHCTDKRT